MTACFFSSVCLSLFLSLTRSHSYFILTLCSHSNTKASRLSTRMLRSRRNFNKMNYREFPIRRESRRRNVYAIRVKEHGRRKGHRPASSLSSALSARTADFDLCLRTCTSLEAGKDFNIPMQPSSAKVKAILSPRISFYAAELKPYG